MTCKHENKWDWKRTSLTFLTVTCLGCDIATTVSIELIQQGLVTGNSIRQSWGQPKDYVPAVPDFVDELLAAVDGKR
jgi:hypothetical protein